MHCWAVLWIAALASACYVDVQSGDPPGNREIAADASPFPDDDVLRFNQIQAKGTHNSYHVAAAEPVATAHAYSHAPLWTQLDAFGVRQLELDLHLTRSGSFDPQRMHW